jgi:pimeloyl-ACP methyl ester carboxylesterase
MFTGCQAPQAPRDPARQLTRALAVIGSPRSDPRQVAAATANYRSVLAGVLPGLLGKGPDSALELSRGISFGYYPPGTFSGVTPVRRSRQLTGGLHRSGLGLPVVGKIVPGGANAPPSGYRVPVTVLALPKKSAPGSFEVSMADPERVESVRLAGRDFPVAMDLEAALNATGATGPRFLDGLRYLLLSDRKTARLSFLQPYDPGKIPVVLVHGLISTPRMWAPVVKTLLANATIRRRYQFWFFYYPTGQPVALSALQLRDALDEAILAHRVDHRLTLIGHSMGGILTRVQVSRLTLADAETMLPRVYRLPETSTVRRCLVFGPRRDVSRVVFICTPHRGSRIATSTIAALGIWLIRLPGWIAEEMADLAGLDSTGRLIRLPTSIHGLSPRSKFLAALNRTPPAAPSHSIIGSRDGVVPFSSAHLEGAVTEVLVPAGHGGFSHPLAIQEIRRILTAEIKGN